MAACEKIRKEQGWKDKPFWTMMGSENQRVYTQWSHIIRKKQSIGVEGVPGAPEPEIWKNTRAPPCFSPESSAKSSRKSNSNTCENKKEYAYKDTVSQKEKKFKKNKRIQLSYRLLKVCGKWSLFSLYGLINL